LANFLGDLHQALWSELATSHVSIGAVRRELQRTYLDQVEDKLHPPKPANAPALRRPPPNAANSVPPDFAAALRADLMALQREIREATPRAGDAATRAHLMDVGHTIDMILSEKSYISEVAN
jgi:hypothetical protein